MPEAPRFLRLVFSQEINGGLSKAFVFLSRNRIPLGFVTFEINARQTAFKKRIRTEEFRVRSDNNSIVLVQRTMIKTPITNFGNCFRKVKGGGKRPWHRVKAWGAISISPFGKGKESLTGSGRRTKTVLSLVKQGPIERAESGVILLHNKDSQFGAIIETRIVD